MLTLEIELLAGVYRASLPDGSAAEWPPHPERVFSALVQAWGDGGRGAGGRLVLEWLETLAPPDIEASPPHEVDERTAPTVYVPPNDPHDSVMVLPERRPRQAREFRVAVPGEPRVRLHWEAAQPDEQQLEQLSRLAGLVSSLGHSSSVVRFEFRTGDPAPDPARTWKADPAGSRPLRAPYPGRLADLEEWFQQERRQERPRSRRSVAYSAPRPVGSAPPRDSVFGGPASWFVFEDAGGFRPDVLATAQVTRRVRDALMSLGPQPPPELLSGHGPGDSPSSRPHVAIVPLANVGWAHSSGDLLGFAVILPRDIAAGERQPVIRALARFVRFDGDVGRSSLHLFEDKAWQLERSPSPSRASLRPERWCAVSSEWASVTPVLLDRFSDDDPIEEARSIAAACSYIGLPDPIDVEIHKHSAIAGATSAYPARGRRGSDWAFPKDSKFRSRPRRHVVLRFAEPVRGPVILGAGRFHGFGLCLPTGGDAT